MKAPEFIRRWQLGHQYGYVTYFKNQDPRPVGKVGVILADMGMPEEYDFAFYEHYLRHVFEYMTPAFVRRFILADTGICLIDPENPVAREPFKPGQLIDAHGSFVSKTGEPYVDCDYSWVPPRIPKNPWDHGCFIYRAEGKGGAPDICQKTGAKVIGWYYGKLFPEKKVAWAYQCSKIYTETCAILAGRYPGAEFRHAHFVYPHTIRQAVNELIQSGCQTLVYQSFSNPVFSDFEEYDYQFPLVHKYAAGRAKVIFADQIANQPALVDGYAQMVRDQLAGIPQGCGVYVILSTHGHPFKKETQLERSQLYRIPLEEAVRQILAKRGGRWDLTWSCDEYADEYWDPQHTKQETYTAFRKAIGSHYDYVIELPTEFVAENTDLMVFHAMKKFYAFGSYNRYDPIPYPDWDKPLVRTFREGKTTGIYAGCPVGPYRKYVVQAVADSIAEVLEQQSS